jgi:hypothetical protein
MNIGGKVKNGIREGFERGGGRKVPVYPKKRFKAGCFRFIGSITYLPTYIGQPHGTDLAFYGVCVFVISCL